MFRPLNPRSASSAAFLFLTAASLALSLSAPAARADYAESILHTFNAPGAAAGDGQYLYSGVAQTSDGTFWGTTEDGGSAGEGTVWKYTVAGKYSVVHNFGDGSVANDGELPRATLTVGPDGNLYGTAYSGGSGNAGVVYKITPSGTLTILHAFQGISAGDGSEPIASVTFGHDGKLYGTTAYGVDNQDGGGDDDFTGADASSGPAGGTIFSLNSDGSDYIVQYRFYESNETVDALSPYGTLAPASGSSTVLYGTTYQAGPGDSGNVFAFTPGTTDGGGTIKILHSFNDGSVANDGGGPFTGRLIVTSSGNLIGTTTSGGLYGRGVLFELAPDGSSYTILHAFGNGTDGQEPTGGLTLAGDGAYYGVTTLGGTSANDDGTVFRALPTSSGIDYSVVYNFQGGQGTGDEPQAKPFEDSDGNLVGTTMYTGSSANGGSGYGTLYKLAAGLPNPVQIKSLTLSPTSVLGGSANSTATITLNKPAGSKGAVCSISVGSNASSVASVPESVTIPAGHETATFTVTTHATTKTITTGIAVGYNDSEGQTPLTITTATKGVAVYTVTASPTSTQGGTSTTANRVTLNEDAPSDTVVTLSSSNTAVATVPSTLTVLQGYSSRTFTIKTAAVTKATNVTITATYNGMSETTQLMVTPVAVQSITLSPTSTQGGTTTTANTVTLTGKADVDVVVNLQSTNTGVATVPTTVTVKSGTSSQTFPVTTQSVTSTQTVMIQAVQDGPAGFPSATLTVTPAPTTPATLSRVTLNPTTIQGGATPPSNAAFVYIHGNPSGDTTVMLTSSDPSVVAIPSSIVIMQGRSSRSFTYTTKPVTSTETVTITATLNGMSVSANLTVTP